MTLKAGITQPKNAIRIIRGSSKTYELSVVDENDDPVDLTGARVLFTVKRDIVDTAPLIQKDSDAGPTQVEIMTPPKAGKARIYLSPSDTQRLEAVEYVFDSWIVLSSGKRHPVIPPSVFEIEPGVTVITS